MRIILKYIIYGTSIISECFANVVEFPTFFHFHLFKKCKTNAVNIFPKIVATPLR